METEKSEAQRAEILKNYNITNPEIIETSSLHTYLDLKDANLIQQKRDRIKPGDLNRSGNNNIDYDISLLRSSTVPKVGDGYIEESDVQVLDIDWACSKYLVPWNELKSYDRDKSMFTYAATKMADTSLGNHSVINPLPQFTRYADPRVTTRPDRQMVAGGTKFFANGLGMGRYYSEAIDDYQQEIFLQFGHPEFNSMLNFLLNAVTYEDAYIANHGRYPIGFGVGSWLGSRLIFGVYPWLSLAVWTVKAIVKTAIGFSPFNYYYLNPNMHNYWGSVNTIVSSMCVELGMFVPDIVNTVAEATLGVDTQQKNTDSKRMGVPVALDAEEMAQIRTLLPGLIDKNGYVDMYAIATRHQHLATVQRQMQMDALKKLELSDGSGQLNKGDSTVLANLTSYIICDDFTTSGAELVASQAMMKERDDYNSGGGWLKKFTSDQVTVEGLVEDTRERVNKEIDRINSDWRTFKDYLTWILGSKDSDREKTTIYKNYAEVLGNNGVSANDMKGRMPSNRAYRQLTDDDILDERSDKKTEEQKAKDKAEAAEKAKNFNLSKTQIAVVSDGKITHSAIEETYVSKSTGAGSSAGESNYKEANPIKDLGNKLAEELTEQSKAFGSFYSYTKIRDKTYNFLDAAGAVTDAVLRDGGLFLGLRVNSTRSITDSFSNSTGPIQTGELIKGISGTARNANFNLSGGNIIPGISDLIGAAKNVVLGVLDGATYGLSSVIASALEGAYIDIPDKWEDSKCNIGTASYSIKLVSPYGNPMSQLQNIYIPLACLLAGVLPQQTGRASHSSPYLCSVFSKGIQNIELGIITELSIERGTSNLPFSKWKKPLAIDVNFTITDLSGIVTAPLNRGVIEAFLAGGVGEVAGQLTTESKLDDYIGTLCSRDLANARFIMPAFTRRLKKGLLRGSQAINPNALAFAIGEFFNPLAGLLGMSDGATQTRTQSSNVQGLMRNRVGQK